MSDNVTLINPLAETETPSTQGMTSKVVKGSLWTLAGQVLPLLVSLISTPFVIRLLGTESYGAYILIGLIITFLSVAEFGMSIASTKFGSQAYANGLRESEGKVVRTSALITFLTSFPITLGLFVFSPSIVFWLNLPEQLRPEASTALKIASITFILNNLCNIFNAPQLARLRMDLNTFVNTGFRLLGIVAIPIILYFGGGLVSALSVLMVGSLLTLLGHLFIAGRLLRELFQFSIDRSMIKPLLKFGGPLFIAGIAGILLINLEKIVLARVVSVEALAYYSVAYTFGSMATMFSGAMTQSLIPAFSQLLTPEKKGELNKLFSRGFKVNIIGLIPSIAFLFVVAKPFFTIWAGESFGRESSLLFYVLLFGVIFNIIAYIPYSLIMASGKTELFARIYWIELFPYIILIAVLTNKFGAIGAAFAWSLRVIVDSAVLLWFSLKITGVSLDILGGKGKILVLISLVLIPPMIVAGLIDNYSVFLLVLIPVCFSLYAFMVWRIFFETDEKQWLTGRIYAIFNR